MLFNSIEFLPFVITVFALYWAMNRWTATESGLRLQNLLLLVASYVFYACWDWRFLSLIAFSTLVDYFVGGQIAKANTQQLHDNARPEARSPLARRWLIVSLLTNLGLLAVFKYTNFFLESWVSAWSSMGVEMQVTTWQIILPVGISFYTFQTLSYSIDIYRRKLEPTKDLIAFAAFVCFFPQLVAGPIEKASSLLPQLRKRRTFDASNAISGVKLFVWGWFKKAIVADNCGALCDAVFANPPGYHSLAVASGAVLFAIQLYGDFSGYSDMAIGTARLFGIRLSQNFIRPFFATNLVDLRRRWHLTLTNWIREYLYHPLGGSRGGLARTGLNILIVYALSGLWHGPAWNWVAWGLSHGILTILTIFFLRTVKLRVPLLGVLLTFSLYVACIVFFRTASLADARTFFESMSNAGTGRETLNLSTSLMVALGLMFGVDLAFEIREKRTKSPPRLPKWMEPWGVGSLAAWILFETAGKPAVSFIYFQF